MDTGDTLFKAVVLVLLNTCEVFADLRGTAWEATNPGWRGTEKRACDLWAVWFCSVCLAVLCRGLCLVYVTHTSDGWDLTSLHWFSENIKKLKQQVMTWIDVLDLVLHPFDIVILPSRSCGPHIHAGLFYGSGSRGNPTKGFKSNRYKYETVVLSARRESRGPLSLPTRNDSCEQFVLITPAQRFCHY